MPWRTGVWPANLPAMSARNAGPASPSGAAAARPVTPGIRWSRRRPSSRRPGAWARNAGASLPSPPSTARPTRRRAGPPGSRNSTGSPAAAWSAARRCWSAAIRASASPPCFSRSSRRCRERSAAPTFRARNPSISCACAPDAWAWTGRRCNWRPPPRCATSPPPWRRLAGPRSWSSIPSRPCSWTPLTPPPARWPRCAPRPRN